MDTKYKNKYLKYKKKYNNFKKTHKITGGLPEIIIGLLSTLPVTSTLNIYNLVESDQNLKTKISNLINKTQTNSIIADKIIEEFQN
tara:strand:+ start:623 stop:880 length:258 start_codon:yes stop_codon:yes gene_type:complete